MGMVYLPTFCTENLVLGLEKYSIPMDGIIFDNLSINSIIIIYILPGSNLWNWFEPFSLVS